MSCLYEVKKAENIFLGINGVEYSGYPYCRREFIEAFETLANLATKTEVEGIEKLKIYTPLIQFTKVDIIQRGIELDVDYSFTLSC